ncbi:hypothetical protein [Gallibacterium anatis]|uniref:hypothetical protein n=1 Tax=Gallibacterium anatis TaxID=750 RepID=UPI000531105C|nr:hypothetical protein [Gallibacterium anatis]KGQ46786.1 hypothetical protein JP29_00860 [Gallibacterium anatis]KGQ62617.1 hypothetical protein IO43_09550 [Gallibacterium anatis 7990]UZD16550.1 hypothetical protein OLL86_03160 [Gallibacterium anatis]HJF78824.1 hypothetical protein [Enterococcus cecorum]
MSLGKLNINLSLETAEFQQGLDKSSHQTRKFIRSFETDLDRAKNSAKQFSERTAKYLNNIERAAISINDSDVEKRVIWSYKLEKCFLIFSR